MATRWCRPPQGRTAVPAAEFRVAVWGPAVTLALAAGFGLGALLGDRFDAPSSVQGVVDYLARINALVLAFNLVPALPLDGGRVLRAWLWKRQQSFPAATRSAARAGQAFGFVLVGVGLLELFGGAGLGGILVCVPGLVPDPGSPVGGDAGRRPPGAAGGEGPGSDEADPTTVSPDLPLAELVDGPVAPRRFSTYRLRRRGSW